MGVPIAELFVKKEISLENLKGKKIVIDSYNHLYQFLSSIRQRDGTLLMDKEGRVTSHLTGLFSRTSNLIQKGLKLAYVFDGKPPKLKEKERERRKEIKKEAEKKYKIAVEKEDIDEMRKYASRTTRLTEEMVDEAKELVKAFGLPVVQAPSEGEAQAAYMAKKDNFFAVSSQDMDSLLFGAPKLIRNLSIVGKKKKFGKLDYITIKPEIIDLQENMKKLKLNLNQLIALAILVGTDFNIGGIKGIGPKNALKLVQHYKSDFSKLFEEVKWDNYFDFSWKEIFDLMINIKTTDDYKLEWKKPDVERIKELLVEQHDFSEERVVSVLTKLEKDETRQQRGLGDFL